MATAKSGHAVALGVLAETHTRIGPQRLREKTSPLLERLVEKRAPVEVTEGRRPRTGTRRAQAAADSTLDAGLEPREVGLAGFVDGDDLTVDDCLPGLDPRGRLEE